MDIYQEDLNGHIATNEDVPLAERIRLAGAIPTKGTTESANLDIFEKGKWINIKQTAKRVAHRRWDPRSKKKDRERVESGHQQKMIEALQDLGIDTSHLDEVEPLKEGGEAEWLYHSRVFKKIGDQKLIHEIMFKIRDRPPVVPKFDEAAKKWRAERGLPDPKQAPGEQKADLTKAEKIVAAINADTGERGEKERKAYEDFKRQNEEMYRVLTEDLGITVEAWDEEKEGRDDPYNSPEEQNADLAEGHLWINRGEFFIGSNPDSDTGTNHPFMNADEYLKFRAVHDAFGHGAGGTGFDRHGEYGAWIEHNSMYTGEGRKAMSTEYHAVNSHLWFVGHAMGPEHLGMLLPEDLIQNVFDSEGNIIRKADTSKFTDAGIDKLIEALGITSDFTQYDTVRVSGLVHPDGGRFSEHDGLADTLGEKINERPERIATENL
jgi:hypothetical protein